MTEWEIVSALAEQAQNRVLRKAIRELQTMRNGLQSGEDSGLTNTWDEICVQERCGRSIFWNLYDEVARGILTGLFLALPAVESAALWRKVHSALMDEDDDVDDVLYIGAVIDHLTSELYGRADEWTNARIRHYLEWSYEFD